MAKHNQRRKSPATGRSTDAVVRSLQGVSVASQLTYNLDARLVGAIERGSLSEVTALLKQGANINAVVNGFITPLMWASKKGYLSVVRFLLDKGARIESKGGSSALTWAVAGGNSTIVKWLLECGADVAVEDENRNTALVEAARQGNIQLVKLLLGYGATALQGSNPTATALTWSWKNGHHDIVELLIKSLKGASTDDLIRLATIEYKHNHEPLVEQLKVLVKEALPIPHFQQDIPMVKRQEDRERARLLVAQGVVEKRRLNYQLAEKRYLEAVQIAPWHLGSHFALGKLYYLMDQQAKSILHYTVATHLHLGLGPAMDDEPMMREAREAGLTDHSPELIKHLQTFHPQADLLLVDTNTPRHLGHALVDLEKDEPLSPDHVANAAAYRQSIAGVFFAQLDLDSDIAFYQPIGISYLLEHMDWEKVNRIPADAVYEHYMSTSGSMVSAHAIEIEMGFAISVLTRQLRIAFPQTRTPVADLTVETDAILKGSSPQHRREFHGAFVQAQRASAELLHGTFYAGMGATLLHSFGNSNFYQSLMARRWRDTVGSIQTPLTDVLFDLQEAGQTHRSQTPMLEAMMSVLRTRELRDLRNGLVHKTYGWNTDTPMPSLRLTERDGTTLVRQLPLELCEAFHITLAVCALVINRLTYTD